MVLRINLENILNGAVCILSPGCSYFSIEKAQNSLRLRYRKVCEDVCCFVGTSVADPGCLSRIPDPDFLPIPDTGSKKLNKREG
jgi:hypothetical protein